MHTRNCLYSCSRFLGVIFGIVSSSACTLAGLLFFTSNVYVSLLAMLSIVISIVLTLGLFWLLGWTLGPIEVWLLLFWFASKKELFFYLIFSTWCPGFESLSFPLFFPFFFFSYVVCELAFARMVSNHIAVSFPWLPCLCVLREYMVVVFCCFLLFFVCCFLLFFVFFVIAWVMFVNVYFYLFFLLWVYFLS